MSRTLQATDPTVADSEREEPTPLHAFIVGSSRSGTTWLQLLLAQHPLVATSQETHIFLKYVGRAMRVWHRDAAAQDGRRKVGLPSVIDDKVFRSACRSFTDTVFQAILDDTSGAACVVEKTPGHAVWGEEILSLYPEAAFIHVIRDPREVVCSLRSAGRSWGEHWSPTNVVDAVRLWRERVEGARSIGRLTFRYREVRYEDLLADTAGELTGILAFLDLPVEEGFCEETADACRIDRLREGSGSVHAPWSLSSEPAGFFRRGKAAGWRNELTRGELRRIEYLASPLMSELGYEPVTSSSKGRRPTRVALREVLEWRLKLVYDKAQGWLGRL